MLDKISKREKKKEMENKFSSGWSLNIVELETACLGNPRRHLTNLILLSMIL